MAQAAAGRAPRQTAPEPDAEETGHSGRLLLRMPQSLHAEIAKAAEREGISMNTFITSALAGAVGWRAPDQAGTAGPAPAGRLLRLALAADLILVAIAACVAIVLLLVA